MNIFSKVELYYAILRANIVDFLIIKKPFSNGCALMCPTQSKPRDNTNPALKQNEDAVLKMYKSYTYAEFRKRHREIASPPRPPNIQTFRERYRSVLGENFL